MLHEQIITLLQERIDYNDRLYEKAQTSIIPGATIMYSIRNNELRRMKREIKKLIKQHKDGAS